VPIVVLRSTSADARATAIARETVMTVTQLTTTPATVNAGPLKIGEKGCGLLPNMM
jgi:hypothetical protein